MSEENKPYLIISKECDEIQINIKHTKPYMKLQQENPQLKEVIEEVREYTEELKPHWLGNDLVLKIIDDLLQILDKGVKDEQESKNN